MRDIIDLDVSAISELKNKGIPATDDSSKYKYCALSLEGQETTYSKFMKIFERLRKKINANAIMALR